MKDEDFQKLVDGMSAETDRVYKIKNATGARAQAVLTKKANGQTVSAETRAKISAGNKGKKLSTETKNKIGEANKGKPRTKEQKEFLRTVRIGTTLSTEHKAAIAKASKNRVWSKEAKAKLSKAKKGVPLGITPAKQLQVDFFNKCLSKKTSCTRVEMIGFFKGHFDHKYPQDAVAGVVRILNHTWPKKKK